MYQGWGHVVCQGKTDLLCIRDGGPVACHGKTDLYIIDGGPVVCQGKRESRMGVL